MDDRRPERPSTPPELIGRRPATYAALARGVDRQNWSDLHWTGSLSEYLDRVSGDPRLARNAFQRLYDMIRGQGVREEGPGPVHYRFFDDPADEGREAIFGIGHALAELVAHLRAAAHGLGPERRVLLLHGPVGSSKSTIVRLMKRGLEAVSRRPEGAVCSYRWMLDGGSIDCPMHEDPLHLLPPEVQRQVFADLNERFDGEYRLVPSGQLCPLCRFHYDRLLRESGGDFDIIERHVEAYRLLFSEQDRVGIGTFQPKDEKNQDSTELTGDINYRLIAELGSDSDPRAFNFDGEFHVANRGLLEFIEILKLDVAFLYDLLGATQEHAVKPKKFAQTDIDEVILGHTNSPEYRRMQNNELMEAFRDRTTRIDVPYNRRLSDEVRIYRKTFGEDVCAGRHLAPHALQAAAMWAVLTRLEEPKNAGIHLVQKMHLYDGRDVPGFTTATVSELRAEAPDEGMHGVSPRFVQDRVAAALVTDRAPACLTAFDVLASLETGLHTHPLIQSEEQRRHYLELLVVVQEELEETFKNEVRAAVADDEDAIQRLCCNYVDAVTASVHGTPGADEHVMRGVEERIGVTEARKSDFRREIVHYIDALSGRGERFSYASNPRLRGALEAKLFEDCRDTLQVTADQSTVVDRDVQEKIGVIAGRMVRAGGYCDACARRALDHVSGIFAWGDGKGTPDEAS